MARIRLSVKNWAEFQHYRDRKPAWIKLHRELLDNYEWHRLPDASRALAPMLWLLASESDDGTVTGTEDEVAFRLRTTVQKLDAALKPLISAGFFTPEQCASKPLAECSSERETEEEIEIEEEERESGALAPSPPVLPFAVELFNKAARKNGWPPVQVCAPGTARRRQLNKVFDDVGRLEGWETLLEKASASDFLTGRSRRSEEHANWRMTFDFLLKKYVKIMEGGYDNTTRIPQQQSGISAVLAALAD